MKKSKQNNAYSGSKVNALGSYSRNRLIKLGINPADIKRVVYPFDTHFSFEPIDNPIEITPLSRLGNDRVKQTISTMYERGIIEQCQCYRNALYIALNLQRLGISAKCVEGIYRVDGIHWRKHRFNEINGIYFDATAEYFLHKPISQIDYIGYRLYSPKELLVVSAAYGALDTNGTVSIITTSTLPYNPLYHSEIGFNDYYLNNNGYIQKNEITAA